VEARGANERGERVTVIAGAAGPTADLAAAVCAATALQVVQVGLPAGVFALGCRALDALDVLHHATRLGVHVQQFTGVARPTSW
jgi:phosphoribosylcarboxyaminoimidazole (NCAIR) mutase